MKKTKKAFTLVELLVVIAILAVLATVGIVGYTSFTKKAKESNDKSVISQINLALQASEVADGKPQTLNEALNVVEEAGFVVANLTPSTEGYDYVYDMKNNRFALMDGNKVVSEATDHPFEEGVNAWQLVAPGQTLSTNRSNYLKSGWGGNVQVSTGLDCGDNENLHVTYNHQGGHQEVTIRLLGDTSSLVVNAPNDDVNFYGYVATLDVAAVASSSLHIYGSVNKLALTSGHAQVETTGVVFDIVQVGAAETGTGATITNNGYVADASLSQNTSAEAKAAATQQVSGKTVGGDYEIGSLAKLETFRETVNAGNSFKGLKVKLVADITLTDGWKPIGEGSREVANSNTAATGTGTFFRGEFDGNGHTIYNLNNIGFVPTASRIVSDKNEKTYCYGLFALVGDGAYFHDLKLKNVNIDTTLYGSAIGDSVGALIGYSDGSLKVMNVEVSGLVKGADAVGGIIGRSYKRISTWDSAKNPFEYVISGCINNANVTIGTNEGQKGAGIVGYVSFKDFNATLTNNTNNGTISGGSTTGGRALRASIAVVTNNQTLTHSGNMNGSVAADSLSSASENTQSLGELA